MLLAVPVAGRVSWLALERGRLEVDGHSLLLLQEDGGIEIPPAAFAALLLEPGVTVTHEAVRLCAENRTTLFWVGEAGTRIYAVSNIHANAERIQQQALIHATATTRIECARRLYQRMFNEQPVPSYTIEKLRGAEGAKVRAIYARLSTEYGIEWSRRDSNENIQQAINFASGCLYNLAEIAVLLLGYSPAIGIVHTGDSRSFAYDLADTLKFNELVPALFLWHKETGMSEYADVRRFCRDLFREKNILKRLIDNADWIIGYDDSGHTQPTKGDN